MIQSTNPPLVFLVLVSIFISFPHAKAQTLLAPSFQSGASFTMGVLNFSEAGAAGENMAWDYSSYVTVNSYNGQILSSSPSQFEDDFPNANWMLESGGAQYYYNYGPDVFEYYGGVEGGVSYAYSDSEIYFPYPFSFGETWTDTFENVLNIFGVETHRSGVVSSEVNGYGTLDLPGGVHVEDVSRLSISRVIVDNAKATGEVTYLIDLDMFYAGTTVVPMVTHTHFQVIEGQDTATQDYTEILQSYLVAVDELQHIETETDFSMFPNPASSKVQFVFASRALTFNPIDAIQIRDITGRLIETLQLISGINSGVIDVSSWAKGVYTATSMRGLENISTKQLIVE